MAIFNPKNSLTRESAKRRAKRRAKRLEKRERRDRVERWEKYMLEMSLTGEPSVCQGGLGFVCSEPAV
jgi:hypothetical protein